MSLSSLHFLATSLYITQWLTSQSLYLVTLSLLMLHWKLALKSHRWEFCSFHLALQPYPSSENSSACQSPHHPKLQIQPQSHIQWQCKLTDHQEHKSKPDRMHMARMLQLKSLEMQIAPCLLHVCVADDAAASDVYTVYSEREYSKKR